MEEIDEPTWITLADGLVGVSFLVLVIGVFVAPLSGTASTEVAAKMLGVALMLFTASPFVLTGHYNLYCSWGRNGCRPRVTRQEWLTAGISAIYVACGILWIWA